MTVTVTVTSNCYPVTTWVGIAECGSVESSRASKAPRDRCAENVPRRGRSSRFSARPALRNSHGKDAMTRIRDALYLIAQAVLHALGRR
jgi:hypothetical protein